MKLTASKTAINTIATYCNKHGITFKQQDNSKVSLDYNGRPLLQNIFNKEYRV